MSYDIKIGINQSNLHQNSVKFLSREEYLQSLISFFFRNLIYHMIIIRKHFSYQVVTRFISGWNSEHFKVILMQIWRILFYSIFMFLQNIFLDKSSGRWCCCARIKSDKFIHLMVLTLISIYISRKKGSFCFFYSCC